MIKLSQLKEELNKNHALYILKGGDSYLLQKAERVFLSAINPEFQAFNVSYFSMIENSSLSEILDAAQTLPAFDEKRVVFVRDTTVITNKMMREYLSNPNPQTYLIFYAKGENLKELEKLSCVVDCQKLSDIDLHTEIELLLDAHPAKAMSDRAKYTLIALTRGDMTKISLEIAKLKAYCDESIEEDAVKELVTSDIETKIYDLSTALSKKNNSEALRIADTFIKESSKNARLPHDVLSQLITHYRRLLSVNLAKEESSKEIANILSVREGAVYHLRSAAKNYSQVRLKKIVEMLSDIQFKAQSQSVDMRLSMMNAVAMLMVL